MILEVGGEPQIDTNVHSKKKQNNLSWLKSVQQTTLLNWSRV